MVDIKEIDSLFAEEAQKKQEKETQNYINRHTRWVKHAKLILPSCAAVFVALILIFPKIKDDGKSFLFDITLPKKGELEKLHIEDTELNITDKNNRVHNFTAKNIDETSPGSKIIKLTFPDGIMPLSDTDWISIKAPVGFYNQNTNIIDLKEDVQVFHSMGINMQTNDVTYNFKTGIVQSNSPIKGDGEMGELTSEGVEFDNNSGIITFKGKTFIKLQEDFLKGKKD